jgi:hypothetical protein
MGQTRTQEFRGFSEDGFYKSDPGQLMGSAQGFGILMLASIRGDGSLYIGNQDGSNTSGWAALIAGNPDAEPSAPATQFTAIFGIHEGSTAKSVNLNLTAKIGDLVIFHAFYDPTTLHQIRGYDQGCWRAKQTVTGGYAPYAGAFGLGNPPAVPSPVGEAPSFLGFAIGPLAAFTPAAIAANTLEILKRGVITDQGLAADVWAMYNTEGVVGNAVPGVLVNRAPDPTTGPNLTLVNTSGTLTAGVAPVVYG